MDKIKPSIVIQTDFSLKWSAVCTMKGVMHQVDPSLDLVDLCHEIHKFDPWEASLSLSTCVPYWPEGTIFVSVVDPGVGTERRACAALLRNGSIVITPDNGTLTHLLHDPGVQEVREIDETINRFHGREEVNVFDGRDLFGYTAARLASSIISFEETGPSYSVNEIVECREYYEEPIFSDREADGFLMTANRHFGGILTNIPNKAWRYWNVSYDALFHVVIEHSEKTYFEDDVPYEKSFGFVKKGRPVLYCGSSGFVAIDLNQENFLETYHLDTGLSWKIKIRRK